MPEFVRVCTSSFRLNDLSVRGMGGGLQACILVLGPAPGRRIRKVRIARNSPRCRKKPLYVEKSIEGGFAPQGGGITEKSPGNRGIRTFPNKPPRKRAKMDTLEIREISGTTFICDKTSQKAWFRDKNGKVRYQAVKAGKCANDASAVQRKTDKRRKPEDQDRITQIWAMLHEPDVKLHNRA